MTITSSDIQNHTFSIDRKGYDVDEVDVFLERLANEVDEMTATIMELESEIDGEKFSGFDTPTRGASDDELAEKDATIADLQRELDEKKANDNAIAQALIIAQRSADEIIDNANHDAAQIRQDAEDEAQRILDKASNEKQRIVDEIAKLEEDREVARGEYQDILKDFISDATKKLSDLGISTVSAGSSAHARNTGGGRSSKNQAPVRKSSAATYTTPQPSTAAVAPATPRPSRVEKDLSGFGDADDAFEFGEID